MTKDDDPLQTLVLQHSLEAESDQETIDKLWLIIIGYNKDHEWAVANSNFGASLVPTLWDLPPRGEARFSIGRRMCLMRRVITKWRRADAPRQYLGRAAALPNPRIETP